MTMTNPAALQGWVKSVDPKSGRAFYANHITRKTQWEPPEGWQEEPVAATPRAPTISYSNSASDDENEPLPSNWEVMHDPTTGKPFYVDHERKITTWTRPKAERPQASVSLRPATAASPSSGNSAALARILQQQQLSSISRSYQQEASYYSSPSSSRDVDLSDSLPALEFAVKQVPDALRPTCPHCNVQFTMSKRRHHCRLCGDVFCDACSNHRCTLPLDGPEFEKPVRVCDFCFTDVDAGNFFSVRRYLTVLHLYEHDMETEDESGVATVSNVNAALSALTQDLQQMLQAGDTNLHEKITLPPDLLLPEILKHLKQRETADRAVCCIAALCALESLANDLSFTTAIYLYGKKEAINDILEILERNGSDRRTLYVQEQAARTLFYLTESKVVGATTRRYSELKTSENDLGNAEDSMDISRSLRNMLDHSSSTSNPNLQRWAAACIKNLVAEDERRATMAVNNMAAKVASGSRVRKLEYESCLDELVSTGGLMILGSLIGADDADTRAHAVSALGAALTSTRAVDASMVALSEMTGGEFGRTTSKDGDIVRAIVAGGGCGASVAQLLLSADNVVAAMGCSLLSSLVTPLLTDPTASATLSPEYDYRQDQTGSMGACREASVEIATGSCLPALLSLVRTQGAPRPIDLQVMAMVTLAAVVSSIGEMGRAWAHGAYEEGLERTGAPKKLKESILMLNEEEVIDAALHVLQSGSGQSLGSSTKDTPSSRIRESAGIILGSLTSCSAEAIMTLQTKRVLSSLLLASNDSSMTTPSALRGDASPRCLGVLEAVASVLMFAWQHPSGASNELLDSLIEMIDAGAVPYTSRVMNTKIDWDSKDKAVGSMKGRAAACKLLCCLFGIALTDETGIGMRRVMDAVDSDARSYRGGGSTMGNQTVPSNIIESTLGVLQTASSQARKALMGASRHGHHYQAALMDLVESACLAAGSMCGSSIAPGGSEGTLITGENFLTSRNDPYVGRRKEICNVACDVVVRGGRTGPTLLPTMIVGGFGEGSVLASLRLALAIAQNGTNEVHAKLALSGILVPISDLLRSALSGGDIYKFSTSLALVRSCGPHVAAGQGGGLESVRDAIRVATNVLTLPINPDASLKQMETQETLKSECISALEALSRNASLWSAISTEALPCIVRYLHTSAVVTASKNPRSQKTKSGALRAVLQIVQVPSHAITAAQAGLVDPLSKLLAAETTISQGDETPLLALEILSVIAKNDQARRQAKFLDSGLARSICAAIGKSATDTPNQPSDSRADVTFLGLEIMHSILSEVEDNLPTEMVLQSPGAIKVLDAVASDPRFVRAMCSTMLLSTNMVVPRHDADASGEAAFFIPKLYGPPLIKVNEKCGGYASTYDAVESLLFTSCVYACAIESQRSDAFWKTLLLQDLPGSPDTEECLRTSATLAAHFLSLMTTDRMSFFPKDANKIEDFTSITRPLVRHRLLEALKDCMAELSGETVYGPSADPYVTSLLVHFNVPHICLSLWKDPALLDLAFELIKSIVEQDPDEVLHLFVEGKAAIMSLFDLLNLDASFSSSTNLGEIRQFLASVLGQLAENGMLKEAVERYEVRSSAIAALAAACLSEQERPPDEDEDMTSNKLSTVLMGCLVDLCTVKGKDGAHSKKIQLSQTEAAAIATNLGKKICHMVLSRFLERSKLQQYEMEEDDDIMDAPDVGMLCAISQHEEALLTLRSIGGLHALSLIAAEGEITALVALEKACNNDANVLLEGDTYIAMMNLVSSDENEAAWRHHIETRRQLESSAFNLLARLCAGSLKGRNAVASADHAEDCIVRAMDIISSLVNVPQNNENEETVDPQQEEGEEDDKSEDDDIPPPPLPPPALEEATMKSLEADDIELGCAACSFLSAVVPSKVGRDTLGHNDQCIKSLSLLSSSSPYADLQLASLGLIMSLAPIVSAEGVLSASLVDSVSHSVLTSSKKIKATATLNANRIQCSAVDGLSIVLDLLDLDKQRAASELIASHFQMSVKNCIVTRATTRDEDRAHAAELAFSLSTALLTIRGKEFANDIFKHELVTSFVHLIQWRQDPKTSIGNTNSKFWDGCVANCLTLLSTLLWRPDEILTTAGIDVNTLKTTPLMLARPGKAPRKAIDFKAALNRIIESADSFAAAAAMRVLDRLY